MVAALLLTACSTTSKIPDDEQLYVGIKKIDYRATPALKKVKIRRDSVGVITTISDAVKAVDNALSGKADSELLDKLKEDAKGGTVIVEATSSSTPVMEETAATRMAFETAKEEVEAVLAYQPNNALFGSSYHRSPLQFGLWAYNSLVDSKSKFGRWMFKSFAQQPILISTVSPDMRAKVAQNTLRNYGFFHGSVTSETLPQRDPKKAKVKYNVQVGPLSLLDSIEYLPYSAQQDSLLATTSRARLLRRGDGFNVVNLANEQTRIGTLFREHGYYYWQDTYTAYQADTLQRKNRVQLRVLPKPGIAAQALHPWYIGHTYVAVRRTERDVLDKTRTRRGYTYNYSGEKMPLRPGMWRHAISHRRGERYSYSDQRSTYEKLNAIGIFSQMDVSYVPRDTAQDCDTLDIYVTALLDKPYDSDFEMNATLKSNQQIGPGLSYAMNKRNAFRGGETVSFKIFGSYEWQLRSGVEKGSSILDSYELGAQLAFKFPRFYAPFISRRRLRFPAETTFALDGDWKRRSGFFTLVSAGLRATYNWHRKANMLHELTPLSIDFNKTINTTAAFNSIMGVNPALYVTMRDQFIPAISYTLTYNSASNHRNLLWLQLHAKEAGNVFAGAYALAGKGFDDHNKKMFGSPFAQFLKATFETHYSVKISKDLSVATRFFGGVLWAYGNSERAPYSEHFYVGGANSVRGFAVRSIGPGAYRSPSSKYAYIDQTGDVKLEANAELRYHLFGSLHSALFLDAGNVWLLRTDPLRPLSKFCSSNLKRIAVGTGLGLRYDLEFLVLRLDLGIGLHAPYATSKRGFYNLERFKDGLNLHFAIGYPF
ncbi:MAG: BamA/TamA family outer membrane protein [Alloprevotella sp.]|nr:BamA/TamA family outer membrane protein [Alloprevotella sp.]